MSQAIITKFLGPTPTRGSRIKAASWRGSVTLPYDHALDTAANYRAAAQALCDKFSRMDRSTWQRWRVHHRRYIRYSRSHRFPQWC